MNVPNPWRPVRAFIASIDLSYFFGGVVAVQVGDALTTYVGVYHLGLGELNPVMRTMLSQTGIAGLLATKLCWFAFAVAGSLLVGDTRQMLKYCFLVYLLGGGAALAVNVTLLASILL